MNQKGIVIGMAVVMAVSVVMAGKSMVTADKLSEKVADANAQILKLQTNQNDTDNVSDLVNTIDAQEETIKSLSADNAAILKLFAMDMGYSEEELEGMTLHEFLEEMMEGGYFVSVHDIWDDTEVVNAYLTGDDSKITDPRDEFVLEKVREIIPEIITEDMTDYEKEKAVYDWQVKYVNFADESLDPIPEYDEDTDVSFLPYGVLKYREAICVGNATTFKLFMDCLEIPCMIIHSTEEGEHAWNLVQIEDDWYHVDITFDSISGDEPMYSYFNVTDYVKMEGGYPWDEDEFPAATSTKYNYAYMNSVEVKDVSEVPGILKDKMENGSCTIFLKCSIEDELYVEPIVTTIDENIMNAYISIINTMYDEEDNVIISIEYYDFNDEPEDPDDPYDPGYIEIDTDVVEKINEAMEEAFGYEMETDYLYYIENDWFDEDFVIEETQRGW